MANRRVTLVRLCKTENGWRRYPAVIGKNGRVKPGFVTVNGKEREYPEGRYQLRTYEGSRMVYRDAGENASDALTARTRAEHLLEAKAAAKFAGVKVEEEARGRRSLARELNLFVQAAEDRGSLRAAALYRQAVDDFLRITGRTFADEITAEDVLKHQRALRGRGQAPRTIHNRHACVVAFLKHLGLDTKELAPTRPRVEKKLPQIYSPDELKAFFGSLRDQHQYLIFELLLKTGLREQEAVYLFWENIDLRNGILRVRSKPELGFKIKDAEERDIPIPADLLNRLKTSRKTRTSTIRYRDTHGSAEPEAVTHA